MIQKLVSLSSIASLFFSTVQALGDVNSEVLRCDGVCADNIRKAIENQGNKYASVTKISDSTAPTGRSFSTNQPVGDQDQKVETYILGTKKKRIFSFLEEKVTKMTVDENNNPTGRFGVLFQLGLVHKDYGCWCNSFNIDINNELQEGQVSGVAQDKYDEACKDHHMGFDCITIDADENGESCDPENTQYNIMVKHVLNSADFAIECADDISTSWCQRRTCMVDLRFIARNWKLRSDGISPDWNAYGHNNGNFQDSVCTAKNRAHRGGGNSRTVIKACCGDYPYRIWYNKHGNSGNKCCAFEEPQVTADYGFAINVGHLYNPTVKTCCEDGFAIDTNVCP